MSKSALITGAAKRIGRAMALHLAHQGYQIFAHYFASRDDAETLKQEIEAVGQSCTLIQADLGDPEQAGAAMDAALAQAPDLSLLINNASRFAYNRPEDFSLADMETDYRTNTLSPIMLVQRFALNTKASHPVVINMLDAKLSAMNPDYFGYTLSKYALYAATEAMAMAFAPKTRVCGIAPGIVLPSGPQNQAEFELAHKNNPLGKGASPAQICRAIDFIVGAESYTGQVLTIDGGETLEKRGRDVAFL